MSRQEVKLGMSMCAFVFIFMCADVCAHLQGSTYASRAHALSLQVRTHMCTHLHHESTPATHDCCRQGAAGETNGSYAAADVEV